MRIQRIILSLCCRLAAAGAAGAEGPANFYNFTEETKIKGFYVQRGGELYFNSEKGGAPNYGYIGRFCPTSGQIAVLYEFPALTKAKGLVAVGDEMWFVTETNGAAHYGYVGCFDPARNTVEELCAFPTHTLAKSAPFVLGTIDLATGGVAKLFDLHAANHGARIKSLLPFGDRIYYTTDEGGDLSLNGGKGSGAMGFFDPKTLDVTRLLVCNGTTTGTKPKCLVAVEDRVFFNCGEGGTNGCGAIYAVADGTNLSRIATLDVPFGNKSDMLTLYGNRLFCATEQGCGNWLGGISAFEVAIAPRELVLQTENGVNTVAWSELANDCVLEHAPTPTQAWQAVAGPGLTQAVADLPGFYRLRR